jgi:hypothetical protein
MFMTMQKLLSFLGLCLLVFLATNALATDIPKLKPGLWEVKMQIEGVPNMDPVQQCIDENTNSVMQQQVKEDESDCKTMVVNRAGYKVTIHSECKLEEMTIISDNIFEGSFDSAYKGTIKTHYNPPRDGGMSETSMTLEARRLGPCQPGQKPGDVIIPQ